VYKPPVPKKRLKEVWINPEADQIRINLDGVRPFWGWNGRLNGQVVPINAKISFSNVFLSDLRTTLLAPVSHAILPRNGILPEGYKAHQLFLLRQASLLMVNLSLSMMRSP
jgi:hypothetical protein